MKHTFKHVGTAALALTLLLSGCSQTAGQTSAQGGRGGYREFRHPGALPGDRHPDHPVFYR